MAHGSDAVLVVDSAETSRLVAACLDGLGCRVTSAPTIDQALAILESETIDLLLLGAGRLPVAVALGELARGLGIPVVLLAPASQPDAITLARDAGVDDLVMMPFRSIELEFRVRALLRMKRAHDELRTGNATLTRQRDSLIDAAVARNRMFAMVVHDLRNPLACIALNAQVRVLDGAAVPDEALSDTLEASDRMMRMLGEMLDISQKSELNVVPHRERFALQPLLEDCCRQARQLHPSAVVDLVCPSDLEAWADRDLLQRVVENLVNNALKHGGGSRVEVAASLDEAGLLLEVSDAGPGISAQDKARVFDAYVQVDGRDRPQGYGLGLAFCKLAVEAHEGGIAIEDVDPRGARFCVRIPIGGSARASDAPRTLRDRMPM